jgi:hypothetical protein
MRKAAAPAANTPLDFLQECSRRVLRMGLSGLPTLLALAGLAGLTLIEVVLGVGVL